MADKVLFVDDDEKILSAFKRQLKNKYDVDVATGAEKGLELVNEQGPYAVIVADLRMPGMDGISFLTKVKVMSPESVRIVLTGYANLNNAMDAVNKGNIFQFLTKPCPAGVMADVLTNAIKQYRLVTAERELLETTLKEVIHLLTEILSVANPMAYGRSSRIKKNVLDLAAKMNLSDTWMLETASMLSQIGLVAAPQETLESFYSGRKLDEQEKNLLDIHPSIANEWLEKIPRMEEIARIIQYQEKHYDGSGFPDDDTSEKEIPIGSRILKVVSDFDRLESGNLPVKDAISRMNRRHGVYDPAVLSAFAEVLNLEIEYNLRYLKITELKPGMVVAKDITAKNIRAPILTRGQKLNEAFIKRLINIDRLSQIDQPVVVIDSKPSYHDASDSEKSAEKPETPNDKTPNNL